MAKKLWEDEYEGNLPSRPIFWRFLDIQTRGQPEVDPFIADIEQFDRALDSSMRNMEQSMMQMQRDMEKEAAMNPGSTNFQSYEKSSSKINDQPELVSVKTNNNGKIDNIEEEIGPDGQARILSENCKCIHFCF